MVLACWVLVEVVVLKYQQITTCYWLGCRPQVEVVAMMACCVSVEDLDLSSAYGTSGCCVSVGGYPSAYGASIRLACSACLGVDWGRPVTHVQVDACLEPSRSVSC